MQTRLALNAGCLFVVAVLVGCVSLAPEAQAVLVTKSAGDVEGCTVVGTVEAHPPYVGPNDATNQLKNQVAGLGGNALFITSSALTATGMAYRCGS